MSRWRGLETRYAGCRFRSRLEARWALALDWLNITWEYEREGYALTDGAGYLPDFYLPVDDIHVEVKGGTDALRQAEPRLRAFAAAGHQLLILADVPDPGPGLWPRHPLLTPDGLREAQFAVHGSTSRVEQCPSRGTLLPGAVPDRNPGVLPPWVARAYGKAREARFEHGATPSRPTEEDRSGAPPLPPVPSRRHNYALVDGRWFYLPQGRPAIPQWRRAERQREQDRNKIAKRGARSAVERARRERAATSPSNSARRVHVSLDGRSTVCRAPAAAPRGISSTLGPADTTRWSALVTCFNCAYRLAKGGLWTSDTIPGKPRDDGTPQRHPRPVVDPAYRPQLPGIEDFDRRASSGSSTD